jgi:competence protein ComEC
MPKILLAAYATGVILAYYLTPWNISGLYFVTGALFLFWALLHKTLWAYIPLLALLCLAGFLNSHQRIEPPADSRHINMFAGDNFKRIEAIAVTTEQRFENGYRVVAEARDLTDEGRQRQAVNGKIMLFIKEGELTARPGQVVHWRSRLRKPIRFGNPGEFDYPLYLASQGIYVTAFVNDAANVVPVNNHPDRRNSFMENLRQTMAGQFQGAVPRQQAALMQSLLLGLRAGVSTEQRQLLASGGIAHLFAISGLHFGLLALLFYQMGKYLYFVTTCV